jgi:DNA-binding GntR family transcriptional regulator
MSFIDGLDLRSLLPKGERRTIAVNVTDCLRNAIQRGILPGGVQLNQVELAEQLGVSRVPVREAMRILEAEGWISARAHHRATVQILSKKRIKQIFDMRILMELHALRCSMREMTPQKLKRLYEMCEQMDRLSSHNAWLKANRAFHRSLLASEKTDLAIEFIDQLTSQIERYLVGRGPVRESQAGTEHRRIVDAISKRNKRAACGLLRGHIETTRNLVLKALKAQEKLRVASA